MKSRKGKFIILLGPDGCGKSTIASQLISKLEKYNYKIFHFHWRPNLIPQLRKQNIARTGGAPPPAPDDFAYGYFISLLRYMYYYMDFLLGYWFTIRPKKAKGYFIIGERWYFDVLIHPARYGFKLPMWLLKIGKLLLPYPDYTFLLSADPQAIHNRKPELTVEQIDSQLSRMSDLIKGIKNASIINTEVNIDETVNTILEICDIEDDK
ncbi:hypothetical protein KAR91_81355 [Candidatus Pacearchaeota archaeon]|nr:hypothetical protein [Candidatus Pacearchaeota archaeon]